MAQVWQVRVGTTVRYRDANARVHHATITAVTDQDTVDLRIGLAGKNETVAGATRLTTYDPTAPYTPGWYRFGTILEPAP